MKGCAIGFVRAQANQASVREVVAMAGDDAVAGGFRLDLARGVVMEIADQRHLVLTDQGQPSVFQFAGDGVGKALAVAQRIRLLE
ncbi:hypothetical protein D3C84_935270 [compost metagenome]